MNKDDWQKVHDWWGSNFYSYINLSVDDHKVSLQNIINKKNMTVEVVVYVDGVFKGEWTDKKSEIGNRFLRPVKKSCYSEKELKERAKAFGKRHDMAQQKYFEYNDPTWKSFASFKKHLTQHNKEIKLIEE